MSLLTQNIWLLLLLWILVYMSDYYLTIYSARLFQGPIKEHIRFEGSFELTPQFEKDIDASRLVSPNFYLRLLLSIPLILLFWWITVHFLYFPPLMDFLIGGLLLREAIVLLRHFRNIALALNIRPGNGLSGRLEYARWLSLKLSAMEFLGFSLFFLFISLILGSWFFLGGVVFSAFTGLQQLRHSKKQVSIPQRT